jgi:hypothetical protein
MNGFAKVIPNGAKGFDTNDPVSAASAALFVRKGFRFAIRYIRRDQPHTYDLSVEELLRLHAAGLAVMPVQHVESESSWVPSGEKGTRQGTIAAQAAAALGICPGVVVWCDLEGVAQGTPIAEVIAYCNMWYNAVKVAGFIPGLYVGWHCGLSTGALYTALRFEHYWAAYNLNVDQHPAIRGVQMSQHLKTESDGIAGFDYQSDTSHADAKGGLALACAPEGWS